MANKITDEELEELNKKLKEGTAPQINENSYIAMLKNLGEKEGYDYVSDYNVIKNSLLQQSYSPRTNKVYTYEEAQTLTPQQYYDDVMAAADHTESGNKVTNALKTFVYGANEAIGGTALYKAIKGEEALQQKANQVERVYGDNKVARGLGNIVGKTLLYTEGSLIGGLPGAAAAGAISEGGQAYTYSNDPATIVGAAERGALFGLVRGGVANSMKNAIANAVPSAMGNVGTNFLINAASQGTGAYAGNAFAGTASNIINAASGKEVTAKDWSKPFWSIEALANAGLSALIGGTINTAIDRAQINQLMTKDLNTMNEQANANAIRVEQALRNGNKVAADIFAKAEIDNIDKFTNNTYAGMKFNDTFKEQMMNDWMNSMSSLYSKYGYTIDYTPTLGTGTSSYGVTPNYATPNTPTSSNTSVNGSVPTVSNSNVSQQSPNLNVTPNIANATNTVETAEQLLPSNIDYMDGKNHVVEEFNQVFPNWQLTEGNVGRVVDFYEKHESDFQDTRDGKTRVLTTMIDDNLVKLTTTVEDGKLYVDELYVEKPNQGVGTKVVNALKNYAKKASLTDIVPMKELSTAKGFWDKALGRDVDSNAANGIISSKGGVSDVTRELGGNVANQTGVVSTRLGIQRGTNSTNNQSVRDNGETNVPIKQNVGSVVGQTRNDGTDVARTNTKLQGTTTNNRLKHKKYTDWENEGYVSPSGTIIRFGEHKDDIVNSLSMEDAGNMFKRAFTNAYSGNKYSNFRDWLSKEPTEKIAKAVLNNELLKTKYISSSKALRENPELLRGVVGAYRNGELIGDDKKLEYGNVDRTKEGKFAIKSYKYEPKQTSGRRNAEDLLKATKSLNKNVAEEAKAEFIINSHDKAWLKREKMTSAEANKIIEGWGTNYSKNALRTIKEVNANVSDYNKWTGIENSNIINMSTITIEDLEKLGLSVKEQDVNAHPDLLKYIANTILAVDTHQSWYGLKVLVETDKFNGNVRGQLLPDNTTIDIYMHGPQTVSHEMGHWLDYQWGSEIATRWLNISHNDFLTHRLDYDFLEKISPFEEATDFIKHFYSFMDSLEKTANLNTEYLQREHEIFARFFADFIKWTSNLAGNDIMENDENITYREEKFTVGQFKEFVKLLQEKSAVTTVLDNNPKTKYNEFERQLVYGDNGDNIADFLKNEFLKSKSEEEFLENIASDKQNSLSRDLSELIVDDKWFENSFKRVYDMLSKKGVSTTNPPLTAINILQTLRGGAAVKTIDNNQTYQGVFDKRSTPLEEANDNLRNELAKKEDEVKATEMWSKRTERGKLNKKLDTAKNKLEQTKFEGKEKLKATKEEGKEKLKKLTSKKNEEKAQAVKDVKSKSNDNIRKLKAKSKEDIREAKSSARATTTDKKLRLSLNRLDKALNNVYDKPRSAETEKALDTVRKQTRGTIKLIDKVKTKLPGRYNFFTDDVLDIIDSYYTGGNTMTDEKRASLIKKPEAIEKFAKEHPEYPISKKALDLLKEPSKKNIADLNEKDLISLAEDLQEIGTAVRDMFSFTRASEDAVKLRNEAIDFARERLERGEGRNYNNLQSNKALNTVVELGENYVDKRSTIQTLTTALSGGDPNSPFNFIPKQLANGYDRYNRAMEKMLKLFDKYVDVKKLGNVRYYDNKLNEIFDPKKTLDVGLKTTNGETYNPTIRDAISVVLGAKDPQFANHTIGVVTDKIKDGKPVLSEGGTAVFSNNIDEKFGRIDKGLKRGVKVKLEASDIQKLEKALEDYPIVKDLMKTYKELTDLSFELTNESYEAINGVSLEKRDYYFPISNDPATRQRQNISDKLKGFNGQDASTTLLNTSIVKPVVEGANGQILIYPIDSVINKLIDNAALYNGYATALYDINTFLSAVSDDGEHLTELINHLDPSYLTNYGKITNALVGNTKPGGKMSSKLGGNYTESILKANFWLALKQAGSYFTAAPFYNHATRSLMAGLFNRGKMAQIIKDYYKDQGIDISKLGNSETLKYFWDDKVNAELSTRTRGYSTLDKKRLLKHTGLLERIDAFDWFKSVDIATINSLAWAMFNDMLLDTNIETDSFMDDLGARYIGAMTSTQPNPSAVTRAPIQVDGNILDKALSYMADPRIKNANALATARMRYKYSKKFGDEEEQKKYGSAYGKIALGTLASLAYITLVSRTKQDAEGKKKETTFWQDMIGNVFGLTIGMEQIVGKFLNDYSFDVSLPDTQALNLIFNFGEDTMKIFSSDNPEKYIDKAIQDLSGFLGIPYKNLKNDYNALTNLFDKETFYKNKIKADSNMYKKYQKFEDEIYNYREFYELYQATREKVVKENYGAYNNQNIKQAIEDYGADLETYYKMFKK